MLTGQDWADTVQAAWDYVDLYSADFGEPDPRANLAVYRAERDRLGMAHVSFQQNLRGVQVMGGGIVVHLDANDKLSSIGGRLLPPTDLNTVPVLTSELASAAAIAYWPHGLPDGREPEVVRVRLIVYSPSWLKNEPSSESHLVWEVWLRGECGTGCSSGIVEAYYIDAHAGVLRDKMELVAHLQRSINDCSAKRDNTCYSEYFDPILNYTFGRREGAPIRGPNPTYFPCISTDVDDAYDIVGAIHNYLLTRFGRNGANHQGGTGNGSVTAPIGRVNISVYWEAILLKTGCPYAAAYFPDTRNITICRDVVIPDLVAHEYMHALWHNEVINVIIAGEVGALNEANSYFLAEAFEHYYMGATDWQQGTGAPQPAIRISLADPPSALKEGYSFRYADRYYSPHVHCDVDDNYFVYNRAGITFKATYLAAVGDYFNGCTVRGIGVEKVEQIWYRFVAHYLVASETFSGACRKLLQATQDLYPGETETLLQVRRALESVEMDQPGRCSGQPARVPRAVDVQGW